MHKTLLLVSCFLLSLNYSIKAQNALNQQLDHLFASYEQDIHPGAAIGVWKDGKVLFAKGYGYANLENAIPFSTETVSDIGSVAKQFTCLAIIALEEEGLLSIDDDVRKYLDYVPDFGKKITIRHLMNHTSGLREIYSTQSIRGGRPGDAIFQEDIKRLVQQQQALNFTPGDRFMYCNTSYAMLADIVEKVGQMPFEEWMRTYIFQSIGMEHTYIMDRHGEIFPKLAESYALQSDSVYTKIFDNSTIRGQGGIYSTLEDMMKWVGFLAKEAAKQEAIFQKMTTKGILNNGDTLTYAAGLYVDQFRGLDRIFHGGASAGYRSMLIYFPNYDLGIHIKTNAPNVPMYDAADIIIEHFLEGEFKDTPRRRSNSSSEPKPSIPTLTEADLKKYTGTYFCPELETSYELFVQNNQLQARHFRHGTLTLQYEGDHRFSSSRGFFPDIKFEMDKKGTIAGLFVSTGRALNIWFEKN